MTPDMEAEIDKVLADVRKELIRAMTKHPTPMHSPHEGWAVILEEVNELWDHVMDDTGRGKKARKEAIQTAAMGLRYVIDVTE